MTRVRVTVRLAGGPVLIALEAKKDPDGSFSVGLLIAAIILLNVGVIPLIVADMGLTRLMCVGYVSVLLLIASG